MRHLLQSHASKFDDDVVVRSLVRACSPSAESIAAAARQGRAGQGMDAVAACRGNNTKTYFPYHVLRRVGYLPLRD